MAFLIIAFLILLNGYFSLAEIALVAVKQAQLKAEEEKQNKKAIEALRLTSQPDEFLGAVQVGITLLGILEGVYGGDLVATQLQTVLLRYGLSDSLAHVLSLVVGIGIITYLTIVIGELLPKSIALQTPLKITLAIAPSLLFFTRIAYPFIKLLTVSTRFLLRAFRIKTEQKEQVTEQDIKRMLSTARQQGVLKEGELWLHQNIFAFAGLTAERMMKPLPLVRSLDVAWSRQRVEEEIQRYPYSFFPVYNQALENVAGLLNVKQFFLHKGEDWQTVILPEAPLFADTDAEALFRHFRERRIHFGLVMNGQKRFIGIVTMHDVMEGVFGDIPELEDYRQYFYQLPDKSWKASGFIHLQRLRRTLKLDWLRPYEEKYINLDEFLKGELGHIPKESESLRLQGWVFTVEEMKEGQTKMLRIEKENEVAGA